MPALIQPRASKETAILIRCPQRWQKLARQAAQDFSVFSAPWCLSEACAKLVNSVPALMRHPPALVFRLASSAEHERQAMLLLRWVALAAIVTVQQRAQYNQSVRTSPVLPNMVVVVGVCVIICVLSCRSLMLCNPCARSLPKGLLIWCLGSGSCIWECSCQRASRGQGGAGCLASRDRRNEPEDKHINRSKSCFEFSSISRSVDGFAGQTRGSLAGASIARQSRASRVQKSWIVGDDAEGAIATFQQARARVLMMRCPHPAELFPTVLMRDPRCMMQFKRACRSKKL